MISILIFLFLIIPQIGFTQNLKVHNGSTIAITNVSVITMIDDQVLDDRTVVIKGGIISAILPSKKFKPSADAQIINGKNQYLMPGLIDVHIHLTSESAFINKILCKSLLDYGVTTALALNGDSTQIFLRDSIITGTILGPRLLISSPKMNDNKLSEVEGRQFVREAKKAGFNFIKIYDQLSYEGLKGVLFESKEVDIPVTGHIPKSAGLVNSLNIGLKRIAHVEELLYNEPFFFRMLQDSIPLTVLDSSKIPIVINLLKKHDVFLSPTLSAFETIIFATKRPDELKEKAQSFKPKIGAVQEWQFFAQPKRAMSKFNTQLRREKLDKSLIMQVQLVKVAFKSGVNIVAGTDAPFLGYMQIGKSLIREMEMYYALGMPMYDVLKTSTVNAAEYLELEDSIGTIAVGKSADLLLLKSNPMKDLNAFYEISEIVTRGKLCKRMNE